jgi:hypothetical protein
MADGLNTFPDATAGAVKTRLAEFPNRKGSPPCGNSNARGKIVASHRRSDFTTPAKATSLPSSKSVGAAKWRPH